MITIIVGKTIMMFFFFSDHIGLGSSLTIGGCSTSIEFLSRTWWSAMDSPMLSVFVYFCLLYADCFRYRTCGFWLRSFLYCTCMSDGLIVLAIDYGMSWARLDTLWKLEMAGAHSTMRMWFVPRNISIGWCLVATWKRQTIASFESVTLFWRWWGKFLTYWNRRPHTRVQDYSNLNLSCRIPVSHRTRDDVQRDGRNEGMRSINHPWSLSTHSRSQAGLRPL